jgi:hypothetical protein
VVDATHANMRKILIAFIVYAIYTRIVQHLTEINHAIAANNFVEKRK